MCIQTVVRIGSERKANFFYQRLNRPGRLWGTVAHAVVNNNEGPVQERAGQLKPVIGNSLNNNLGPSLLGVR